jgi:hypothetical protein
MPFHVPRAKFAAAIAVVLMTVGSASAHDDTHQFLEGGATPEVLSTNYLYTAFERRGGLAFKTYDARTASWTNSNSGTATPMSGADCTTGANSLNRFPVTLRDTERVVMVGGTVRGEVPQTSDHAFTACDSAALTISRSPGAIVDGFRSGTGWDGIRIADGTANWLVTNTWINDTRDDCIDNNVGRTGVIRDSLFDGCGHGVSLVPGDGQAGGTVTLDGVLMRMKPYLIDGTVDVATGPLRLSENSPGIIVRNTTIAIGQSSAAFTFKGVQQIERLWNKIQGSCSNNTLLWFASGSLPEWFPPPPACFTTQTGSTARTSWTNARTNWINCHPNVPRITGDPTPVPASCNPAALGGGS